MMLMAGWHFNVCWCVCMYVLSIWRAFAVAGRCTVLGSIAFQTPADGGSPDTDKELKLSAMISGRD